MYVYVFMNRQLPKNGDVLHAHNGWGSKWDQAYMTPCFVDGIKYNSILLRRARKVLFVAHVKFNTFAAQLQLRRGATSTTRGLHALNCANVLIFKDNDL